MRSQAKRCVSTVLQYANGGSLFKFLAHTNRKQTRLQIASIAVDVLEGQHLGVSRYIRGA